jgi:hypothetical protein
LRENRLLCIPEIFEANPKLRHVYRPEQSE